MCRLRFEKWKIQCKMLFYFTAWVLFALLTFNPSSSAARVNEPIGKLRYKFCSINGFTLFSGVVVVIAATRLQGLLDNSKWRSNDLNVDLDVAGVLIFFPQPFILLNLYFKDNLWLCILNLQVNIYVFNHAEILNTPILRFWLQTHIMVGSTLAS